MDLQANVGIDITHQIEVRDFDFIPEEITIVAGETIEFLWTGNVPHTSTSDALSGPDSWDSGLLDQGAQFEVLIHEAGSHPYYCAPHGGPNGIGMAGIIEAIQPCIDNQVQVQMDFLVTNGSDLGYRIFIDGNLLQADPFDYINQMGHNEILIRLPADGSQHILTVQDMENAICAASIFVDLPLCGVSCSMENLIADFTTPNLRLVEVRDFEFVPRDIAVEADDIIRFNWTGDIPHTVTSSASSGNHTFNSGLLTLGAQWELQLDSVGRHDYYCIPHGTAAGAGMAGSINVVDRCDNDSLWTTLSFSAVNGNLQGYRLFIDGIQTGQPVYPYRSSGENRLRINLPGDGQIHEVGIYDVQDTTCFIERNIMFPNCQDPCYNTIADFTYSIDESTRTISFQNQSSSIVDFWSWNFGDGTVREDENPVHIFDSVGTYEICLSVLDSATNCSARFCDRITLGAYRCEAAFTFAQDGLSFSFTDASQTSDTVDRYSWIFGDGNTSNLENPVHQYSALGVYEVCLTVLADSCVSSVCQTFDLTDPCLQFRLMFEVEVDPDNLSIVITDQTEGQPNNWLWGFGDGATSFDQHPEHQYDSPGLYTICLFASNSTTGCFSNLCEVIDLRASSIEEVNPKIRELKLFPNPTIADGQPWIIRGVEPGDYGVILPGFIYDFSGKVVKEFKIDGRERMELETNLNPGVYILRMRSDTHVYHVTLVVL